MKIRNAALWAFGSVLAVSIASPVMARDQVSVSNVSTFALERVDGSSILVRTRKNVGMTLNMRGLQPGGAYTNWWVNFNKPARCLRPCACGSADFDDPAVHIGVFWADGRVADSHGQAQFAASVAYGELPQGDDQVPFDPDFVNPIKRGAEIHLVVRNHGVASDEPGALEDQLTKFQENIGDDTHAAVHTSPSCKNRDDDDDDDDD